MAGKWCPCIGLGCPWRARNLAMEAQNCGSRSIWHLDKMCCFFPVWLACGIPTTMWMASYGIKHYKGKYSHKSLGWWDYQHFACLCDHSVSEEDLWVQGKEINVWVDASSLLIRVLLKKNRAVVKDACWLRPVNNAAHINLAELDTTESLQTGAPVRK